MWRSHGDTCRLSNEERREQRLVDFLLPDVILEEFPNLLTPLGKRRDLAAAPEGAERGKKFMSRQMYKIKQEIAELERVALEVGGSEGWLSPLDRFRRAGS